MDWELEADRAEIARLTEAIVLAVIYMVSRYWIATLVSPEETSAQVRVVFDQALVDQGGLLTDDPARLILLAVSDNGPAKTVVRHSC